MRKNQNLLNPTWGGWWTVRLGFSIKTLELFVLQWLFHIIRILNNLWGNDEIALCLWHLLGYKVTFPFSHHLHVWAQQWCRTTLAFRLPSSLSAVGDSCWVCWTNLQKTDTKGVSDASQREADPTRYMLTTYVFRSWVWKQVEPSC